MPSTEMGPRGDLLGDTLEKREAAIVFFFLFDLPYYAKGIAQAVRRKQ